MAQMLKKNDQKMDKKQKQIDSMNEIVISQVQPLILKLLQGEDCQSALTLKRKDPSDNENVGDSPLVYS